MPVSCHHYTLFPVGLAAFLWDAGCLLSWKGEGLVVFRRRRACGGRVVVSAPSHLHAGNIDFEGGLGRLYGTLGFTVAAPRMILVFERCSGGGSRFSGPGWASGLLEYFSEEVSYAYALPPLCGRVLAYFPRGVGLGATTALALSVVAGFERLFCVEVDLADAAVLLGRSTMSALGFYSFTVGGMVLDGGFRVGGGRYAVPPLIARHELPLKWRFIIVVPWSGVEHVRPIKEREDEILDSMPKPPSGLAERLSRLLVMKLLPAVVERDLKLFLEALTEFNSMLGSEYWSSRQGGTYCCRIVDELARFLKNIAGGVAQSSWGPTVYTVVESYAVAREISLRVKEWLRRRGGGLVYVSQPDNRGALIRSYS